MDSKSIYNMAYNQFTPDFISKQNIRKIDDYLNTNAESLINYLDKYLEQFCMNQSLTDSNWLELGCGLGTLSSYIQNLNANYTGLDFSELAISQAKLISSLKNDQAKYILGDITNSELSLEDKFDFIVDSHLLHCLTTDKERKEYFRFIKRHLKPNGVFVAETMCFDKNMNIPVGYEFCENYTLKKEIKDTYYPIRVLKTAKMIEEELGHLDLKIKTFFYHAELGFNIYEEYPQLDSEKLPRVIRFSLTLA